MKIAILGAGHAGCVVAGDLSIKGHDVTLIKTSNSMHNENFNYLLKNNGKITLRENEVTKTTRINKITKDLSELSKAEIIIVYIQTTYHEDLIRKMKDYIQDEQIILFNPGYFSTAYMLKHGIKHNITIVEAQSSFIDCRIIEPGVINVGFRNVRNPLGVYPNENLSIARNKLDNLGYPFKYLSSTVEAALHNPNLIVHTVGAIMSIPRIEKTNGDYVMYYEVFTPSVWNILEKLDEEKMNVLEKIGFERISYVEACKYRNSLDDTLDAKEVFFKYAMMPNRSKGPVSVRSRYITEDVPEGLVMLESIAKQLGIKTPVCTALIEIASAALEMDMRKNGRTPERLGKKNIEKILEDRKQKVAEA
ncbi:NAD/NADP octopine/nopaline dehydrogenase family protein [Virgibacillus pantothenticus]|uniref:NAD/NADP octopine/nopaline dehydrogenase family protein n=1 Tax=Virgibacillus pantothenticus TaxID=1473 RepID=UPI001C247C52|nr:NAD/NADP octopine/nopaline dehydrogenase family protein [Virgibacillus pantothenticus]MBU8567101.1 NAD/NADP octopine/nopaline dehydrogenase family protein [Virgibacillus pantothenticus]MBU8600867.1 NAD/NADP octopine/nopaline dehydrogenase family protein [Virgibacillus pantothenticus]MBU8635253.1 NAD/NADP octopine/nopaline dehydrogenase family protein [Virgibacillus pantothenticus]MBU8642953.1 NAD/NADP octopine/nopaline dehydrogenase family protein [Virgibacillus pantothenticus]MBU8647027.1 